MKKNFKTLLSFFIFLSIANASDFVKPQNVDVENGKRIYEEKCSSCHGEKGMASQGSVVPPLNGQYSTYMVIQLNAFADERFKYRRDSGNSDQMTYLAKELSEKEKWDVSTYLENVKERRVYPPEWWEKNKKDIEWANKYRKSMCTACHGQNHSGKYMSAPKLAGLQAEYLKIQDKAFSDGSRRGGLAHHMKLLADFLSSEDERKMFLYIESQEEYK